MSDLFEQLVKDHANMSNVFDALEAQVEFYSDHKEADWEQVLNGLEYIAQYPERYHHPLEEKALDYLESRHLADAEQIGMIREQHVTLEKHTKILSEMFDSLANQCLVSWDKIRREFGHYIDIQRRHIKTENEIFFPLLQALDEDAWDAIGNDLVSGQEVFIDNGLIQQMEQSAKDVLLARTAG